MNLKISTLWGNSYKTLLNNTIKIPGKIISSDRIWKCLDDFYINTDRSSHYVDIKKKPKFVKILKEALDYSVVKIYE